LIFGVNPLSGRENEDGVLKMENQRLLRLVRCERDKQWRERDMRDVRGERVCFMIIIFTRIVIVEPYI
jgi:hypothetical protein